MTPRISIIIITYNSVPYIGECLASIPSRDDLEIILIDNSSSDKTVDFIKSNYSHLKLVENKKNYGFAVAANRGFAESKGDIILFLNPDTKISNRVIDKLLIRFAENSDAAIIGPQLRHSDESLQPSVWKKLTIRNLFLESFLPYKISLSFVTVIPSVFTEVKMVSGACLAIRREVFDDLGGFDERYFMYYEDVDLCYSALKKNYKIFYDPDIIVMHHQWKSSEIDFDSFISNILKSKLLFFQKHYSEFYSLIASVIIMSSALLRIPVYFIAGIITSNKKFTSLSHSYLSALRGLF